MCSVTVCSHEKLHERQRQPAAVHFQCTLTKEGVWHRNCSEPHDGSDLSDHRCRFEIKTSSGNVKAAAICRSGWDCLPIAWKIPCNISSFWSSIIEGNLIIVVSHFPALYDMFCSVLSTVTQTPERRWQKKFRYLVSNMVATWCKSIQTNANHVPVKQGESKSSHTAFNN